MQSPLLRLEMNMAMERDGLDLVVLDIDGAGDEVTQTKAWPPHMRCGIIDLKYLHV